MQLKQPHISIIFIFFLVASQYVFAESPKNKVSNDANLSTSQLIDKIIKGAKANDIKSQYMLAMMYLRGEGVKRDKTLALKWMSASASGGYVEAEYVLGLMFDRGTVVPQSYLDAFSWIHKAAENNFPPGSRLIRQLLYPWNRGQTRLSLCCKMV
ncbi:MAG: sel1 repeat family protein [Methylococcales bacterium]|nr:sel1 repeat family protein [Methylococcales bacterium]